MSDCCAEITHFITYTSHDGYIHALIIIDSWNKSLKGIHNGRKTFDML